MQKQNREKYETHYWEMDSSAFKDLNKETPYGWLILHTSHRYDHNLQVFKHDRIQMRDVVERYHRGRYVSTKLSFCQGYKIHLNILSSEVVKCWDIMFQLLENNQIFKESILSIKSTTCIDDSKMQGVGKFVIYPQPNVLSSQEVLNHIIQIFSDWIEDNITLSPLTECYHVKGIIYYSGGNRIDKKYAYDYATVNVWDQMFYNQAHILWKNQVPLDTTLAGRTQEELEIEVQLTDWFKEKTRYHQQRVEEEANPESSDEWAPIEIIKC